MAYRVITIVLFCLLLAPALAEEDKALSIQFGCPARGSVAVVLDKETTKIGMKLVDNRGKVLMERADTDEYAFL